jgi:hypothetical protein
MNAYATDTAIDTRQIETLVRRMAEENGGAFIRPDARYTPALIRLGQSLLMELGATVEQAEALRPHELTAFYSVARKSPEAAKRMALKQFRNATPDLPAHPAPIPGGLDEAALAAIAAQLLQESRATTLNLLGEYENSLPAIIAAELEKRATPRKLEVTLPDLPSVTIDTPHKAFPRVLRKAVARRNVYLVGGMGTGKTTLAMQLAEVLSLSFYMASSVFEEHKLFGYCDAGGKYVTTDFRRAYEFGGVFLFDELDRSDPSVVVAFNAALANGQCAFPDGIVKRHKDCIIIAAGNTALRGANREFNAAQKMDSSVLDRFCMIPVELDLELEAAICINADWLKYCRAMRHAAAVQAIDLAVTPRASIEGAIAIAEGDTWLEAADGYIWKGLDKASRERLERSVPIDDYTQEGIL